MPPPTSSLRPGPKSAAAPKDKPATSSPPADKSDKLSKPDQVVYNKEQDELNKEIDAVKAKLVRGWRADEVVIWLTLQLALAE
jgi:hypothetical protein